MLFADVRGSARLAEQLVHSAYAALLNLFYNAATEALIRHDELIDSVVVARVL